MSSTCWVSLLLLDVQITAIPRNFSLHLRKRCVISLEWFCYDCKYEIPCNCTCVLHSSLQWLPFHLLMCCWIKVLMTLALPGLIAEMIRLSLFFVTVWAELLELKSCPKWSCLWGIIDNSFPVLRLPSLFCFTRPQIGWGWQQVSGDDLVQPPAEAGHLQQAGGTTSRQLSKVSKQGGSKASLGYPFQCSSTCAVKNHFILCRRSLLCSSLCLFPLVLALSTEKSLALSLHHPFRFVYAAMRSPSSCCLLRVQLLDKSVVLRANPRPSVPARLWEGGGLGMEFRRGGGNSHPWLLAGGKLSGRWRCV